jgi:two-component system, chemotaxis family, protein-glutamate methylesterase/glutaminase
MSAGSLRVLETILRALPKRFPGALVVAHHVGVPSILPELIPLWTGHECRAASAGEPLRSGVLYIAPPQHHIVINPDATIGISPRDRVHFVRPSVDWLFESVAASFGDRAIAVVLSGANSDGAHGVRCIARRGGQILVQDPDRCDFPAMPRAAIATGVPHRVLAPDAIGRVLGEALAGICERPVHAWHSFHDELAEPAA